MIVSSLLRRRFARVSRSFMLPVAVSGLPDPAKHAANRSSYVKCPNLCINANF